MMKKKFLYFGYPKEMLCVNLMTLAIVVIIFLDIDGVLNNNVPYQDSKPSYNESCIHALQKLCKLTGARIILHSGWRRFLDDNMDTQEPKMQEILDILLQYGLKISDKTSLSATTPEIIATRRFSKAKPKEIAEYVKEHGITRYVILDDLHLKGCGIDRHCYKVNSSRGLTEQDIPEILNILHTGL